MGRHDYSTKAGRWRFYNSTAWRGANGLRNQVLKRDRFECVWCREQGRVTTKENSILEVDHIIPIEVDASKATDINNLRVLCRTCHNKRHERFGFQKEKKKNKFVNDERW